MRDLIIKADRTVLNLLTAYIRRWIERKEEKEHKVDFLIKVESIQFWALIVWAIAIPIILHLVSRDVLMAGVHGTVWSLLAWWEYKRNKHTKEYLKPFYDWVFAQRENPAFYETMKEEFARTFEASRKVRLGLNAVVLSVTVGLFGFLLLIDPIESPTALVWQYLLVGSVVDCIKRYVLYVFDFEKPKRKKKVSHRVTDLFMQMWRDITGQFVPQPV